MYEAKGVGLSAPQINVAQRMVVCDVSGDRNKPVVLINPVITEASDLQTQEEGCLSFPGFYEKVKRGQHITVTAQDTTGKEFSLTADGLEAICIQHECDHLDGKLFVDYLSKLRSSRIRKKMLRAD